MTPYEQLLDDLAAEQAALDAVLGRMTEAQWNLRRRKEKDGGPQAAVQIASCVWAFFTS